MPGHPFKRVGSHANIRQGPINTSQSPQRRNIQTAGEQVRSRQNNIPSFYKADHRVDDDVIYEDVDILNVDEADINA